MPRRRPRLPLERPHQALLFNQEILEPRQIDVGRLQPTDRAVAAMPVLDDPGRLLDDGPMLLGSGVEHTVDPTLADEHVLVASHAAVTEHFLNVEQTARRPIHFVFARTVSIQATRHRDLREIESEPSRIVVERQGHLSATERRAHCRPCKYHVLHPLGTERARGLGTQYPSDRIDDVRLSRAVRADDDRHARLALDPGAICERLEADEGECLQMHG